MELKCDVVSARVMRFNWVGIALISPVILLSRLRYSLMILCTMNCILYTLVAIYEQSDFDIKLFAE